MHTVTWPAQCLPVLHEADVCVLGGSCTGVFAAVRAARLGLRVVLAEKQNSFGGVATQGLVTIWHTLMDMKGERQIIAGLTQEVLERLKRRGAYFTRPARSVYYTMNTEELKIDLDELVLAEKTITPLLHAPYAAPYIGADGELKGAVLQTKSGLGVVLAKVFVDATGDGDLLRDVGAAFRLPDVKQPPSPGAKFQGLSALGAKELHELIFEHGGEVGLAPDWGWSSDIPGSQDLSFHVDTHVFGVNCADVHSLTFAEMEGRRQVRAMHDLVRKYRPELHVTLVDLSSYIGIRETRHFDCLYRLQERDLLGGQRFEDAIGNGTYPVDVHHDDKPGLTFKYLDGTQRYVRDGFPPEESTWLKPGEQAPNFYQIPYRCLVPKSVDNVIAAGRMLDADVNAYGAIRVMVNANQTGEAAGVACYCALSEGTGFAGVRPAKLRELLAEGGSAVL
ncbi:MAG TPA: FAD-dependent oxidoreductase [Clostridia bacterium]|nr:FAD-dependent oxidoreductase [Clostridia bacterium]